MKAAETTGVIVIVFFIIYCLFVMYQAYRGLKKLKKIEERNFEVYGYRQDLLSRIDFSEYKKLPTYREMVYSEKELTDDNWLNKD